MTESPANDFTVYEPCDRSELSRMPVMNLETLAYRISLRVREINSSLTCDLRNLQEVQDELVARAYSESHLRREIESAE